MDTIYYYYFLFYTEIIPDDQPHETTIFVLSFQEGFLFGVILDVLSMIFFRYDLIFILFACVFIFIWSINYFYFYRSGRCKQIVKDKPKIFGSHEISKIITIIFFAVTTSSLFWGPFLTKYLHDIYCK